MRSPWANTGNDPGASDQAVGNRDKTLDLAFTAIRLLCYNNCNTSHDLRFKHSAPIFGSETGGACMFESAD